MFDNCSFLTNIYGAHQIDMNRKQKTYTLNYFKAGIVKNDTADSLHFALGNIRLTESDEFRLLKVR